MTLQSASLGADSSTAAYGEELLLSNFSSAIFASMPAADSSSATEGSHGNSTQLLVLTGLICLAVLIAIVAALIITSSSSASASVAGKRKKKHSGLIGSAPADEAVTSSAPTTRRSSVDKSGCLKFASSDQLDRVDLVNDNGEEQHEELNCQGEDALRNFKIKGPVEMKLSTKLDLVDGILYLHGFRLRFCTEPCSIHLDSKTWRASIELSDNSFCQRWSIEAGLVSRRRHLARRGRRAPACWQTEAMDYVASLRFIAGRLSSQLPHERQLSLTAWLTDLSQSIRLHLGDFRLPLHLVNEPGMEFSAEVAADEEDSKGTARWHQLRPLQPIPASPTSTGARSARLHLGLLYSPGAATSSISVRLVEVFDLDDFDSSDRVTASVALVPPDPSEPSTAGVKCLTARPAGGSQSAHVFDLSQQAAVLAIDNARLQAAAAGVAIFVAIGNGDRWRSAGRILLSDFALASSSSAMRHWTAAIGRPNAWVWLTHACR